MSYKIFDFGVVNFSQEYLDRLPNIHLDYLVNGGLAANDIGVFARIFITTMGYRPDQPISLEYYNVNHLVLRRLLSSKVFEFVELLEHYARKIRRSRALISWHSFANSLEVDIARWKAPRSYSYAAYIRNNVTNHYAVREVRERAGKFPKNHRFKMILANQSANTLVPLAEEIAHLSGFENFEGDLTSVELDDWL